MTSFHTDVQIINLDYENELRLIICEPGDKAKLKLIEGSAEIFGSDLFLGEEYEFSYFSSVAVFTWTGCTLKLKISKYTRFSVKASTQVQRMKYLHEQIEETRVKADEGKADFPVVLLAGPTDVGKSTLCRFLLNYAVKCNRQPIFIDLDVGQSSVSISGTISVLPIHEQSDANGKFNDNELCGYYFGYKSPGHNMKLYKLLLEKVAKSLKVRLKLSRNRNSGVVIDTCGWVQGAGYKLIKEIIELFDVNMVLVLSEASLYSKLEYDMPKKTELTFVKKFQNVSHRNQTVRRNNRDNSVIEYFYGKYGQLKPYTIKIHFKELQIYKANCSVDPNVTPVLIEPHFLYQVLALSYTQNTEKILLTSIYGFIAIIELDMDSEIVTVLSPQPGPLPTNYLIMGDITFTLPKQFAH